MNVNCINPLQRVAHKSSLPVEFLRNQIYAVFNGASKWSKAFIGPPSGNFQVQNLHLYVSIYIILYLTLYKHTDHLVALLPGRRRTRVNALRVLSARFGQPGAHLIQTLD